MNVPSSSYGYSYYRKDPEEGEELQKAAS
jgi:hypothetical protein